MIDYAVKNNIFIVFRCHSFWIQDTIPYQQDRFKQRVYGYGKTISANDECEICQAPVYPYRKRSPCDAEKHIAACKVKSCAEVRNGEKGRKFLCQQCHSVRNYQCGFCYKKFFTSGQAEHHIDSCHFIDTLADFKCEMCEFKDEFLAIPIRQRQQISTRNLSKWISSKIRAKNFEKEMELLSIQEEEQKDDSDNKMEEKIDLMDKNEFPSLSIEECEAIKDNKEEENGENKKNYAFVVKI